MEGPAASCELLVELIDTLRQIDRLTAQATELLAHAQVSGKVEEQTGLPAELWLAAAGRRTRADRRMLTTTAEFRDRLPSLAAGFDDGRVSWAQVRAVVCACIKLPGHLLAAVDDALAREIDVLADAEPDALVHVVSQTLRSLDAPTAQDHARDVRDRFLTIQPRLDGTGGQLYGETDAYGLAILTEALDAGIPPPDRRLRDHLGQDVDPDTLQRHRHTQGRRRMDALIAMAAHSLVTGQQPARTTADTSPASAPTLLLTLSYDTLIGATDEPGGLLTTLTGGRLTVAADTARRLVDQAGASLRTIVLDDTGQILGVGRKTYRPPGWLRDALLLRDTTCRAPGCLTAARLCDLDHADPWTPTDDRPGGGTTDIHNLVHLCRTDHTTKTRHGWHTYTHPDHTHRGLHRWHHRRTGLTIDTTPTTRTLPIDPTTHTARAGPNPARTGPSP